MALNIDRIRNIVKDAVGWSLMAFVVLAFVLLVVMKVRNVWEPPNDVHSLAIASSKFSILCVCVLSRPFLRTGLLQWRRMTS